MCHTDEKYVQLCLNGNPEAFRNLVQRHQRSLARYLTGRLGDEEAVAEAAQETFVRAYFSLTKLREHSAFFSWLVGIAGRVAKETHRGRRRQRQAAEGYRQTRGGDGNHSENDLVLQAAVAALPEPYRQVILFRYYAGRSCAEISSDLAVPIGTVTKRLSRAYAMLRKSLRPQGRADEVQS